MSLVDLLSREAQRRGLLDEDSQIDLKTAFVLVRDMRYQRASDRRPETIIREWRGTCSGKHYLLKEIFAELGYHARLMACTNETSVEPENVPSELIEMWENSGRRFVDVHNFLVLELPEGQMLVDATWPISAAKHGLPVNRDFIPGIDQELAAQPIQTWDVPETIEAQEFKQLLLEQHYTREELAFRDAYVDALGNWMQEDEVPG